VITHRISIILALVASGLVIPPRHLAVAQELSAKDLVMRFCELDSQGAQLTPDGWERVAAMFVAPGAPHHDRIMVVRDFDITRPVPQDGKIGFIVYYKPLGLIDPEARFTPLPHDAEVRGAMFGIKSSAHGSPEWRLEGPVPEPNLKLNAAIRHVTELRANAKDNTIRKNADRTLYMLKRLR
jgi:hypothetical protein